MWMSGLAPIKAEYLRPIPRVDRSTEDEKTKRQLGRSKTETSPNAIENGHLDDDDDDDNEEGEDPVEVEKKDQSSCALDLAESRKRKKEEKKKFRGQNKKRPRPQRPKDDERLCLSVLHGRTCPYGANCRFTHDLEEFWRCKPPDIADRCPNYEAFGKCMYGFSCRFAGAHVDTTEWKNLEDPEKLSAKASERNESNQLEKEVQNQLRRRQYDFKRALQIVSDHTSKKTKANELGVSDKIASDDANCPGTVDVVFSKEKRTPPRLDWGSRLYLAPLTTVGNLPFRRICTEFGAEVTCGEMAMAFELLQGRASEWALVKRHASERIFGVQVCGNYPDVMTKCAQVLSEQLDIDFIDINMGCPIDLVCEKGAGCSLMTRQNRMEDIVRCMRQSLPEDIALTAKMRTGYYENKSVAHLLAPKLSDLGVSLFTLHGRSREQRYTKFPDWAYITQCAKAAAPLPCFGCGDVLSYEDYYQRLNELLEATTTEQGPGSVGVMIARGALIKPWIFTEVKERRHWDISSTERLDILKRYVDYGLQHWGSDQQGVNNTRRFLLEWLSFLHRYIPLGILERVPQKINERPPAFVGRDDLETLMASSNCADWIKITEMLLGPVPPGFSFLPKHKANSYQ